MEKLSKKRELELISGVISDDIDAKEELYEHFYQSVLGFFKVRIKNQLDAEDLTQEAFVLVERKLKAHKYDPKYRFYTFLRNFVLKPLLLVYFKRNPDQRIFDDTGSTEPDQDLNIVRLEMISLLFLCGGKPHQILAFCYRKLLEWKPMEMVNELSPCCLGKLSDKFNNAYYECVCLSVDYEYFISNYCMLFIEKLDKSVTIVYAEPEYKSIRAECAHSIVKELQLKCFYGEKKQPAETVSGWTYRVMARLKKAVKNGYCPDFNPEPLI